MFEIASVRSRARIIAAVALSLATASASAQLANHRPDALQHDGFEGVSAGPFNDFDAARFLTQATYGPTLADIAHLRSVGYDTWLTEQFAAPASLEVPYLNWVNGLPAGQNSVYQQQRIESWLINSIGNPDPSNALLVHSDQLRQKVAYALSQILVISDRGALEFAPWSTASYYDVLTQDAFGNYRTLLQHITLHPAMGVYLSMIGNRKPDTVLNIRPDENFAREVLQLFSVGLNLLNVDGSNILSGGQPVATYTQNTVRGFAHVFTGWNWSDCSVGQYPTCGGPGNPDDAPWQTPMVAFEAYHDNVEDKQLLNYSTVTLPGGVLAHGGTAGQELDLALDNIFNHPNVGPFISKQLIQRLVTSNPTPAYVSRVAGVFNGNGSNVRGDLGAVVKAILLDPEARYGQWSMADTFGKPREPFLKVIHMWRALPVASNNGRLSLVNLESDPYGQRPLHSPSVFNFYRPNFQQPGEIRNLGLFSPEYQITTDSLIVSGPNDEDWKIFYFFKNSTYSNALDSGVPLIDQDRDKVLNNTQLLDRYNLLFMSGQMSPFMRTTLMTRLGNITRDGRLSDGDIPRHRVQQMLYLILTSPEYSVQK